MKLFLKEILLGVCLSITTVSIGQVAVLQPNGADGIDALISSRNNTTNYGSLSRFSGRAWTTNGVPKRARGLLDFNFSSLPYNITIIDAKLTLTPFITGATNPLTGDNAITISRVIEDWDEQTVTWDTQPATDIVNQVSIASSSAIGTYEEIDVTDLIIDRIDKPCENFGMLIQLVTEIHYRAASFATSDHADPSMRPRLQITYEHGGKSNPENPVHCDYVGAKESPQTIINTNDVQLNLYPNPTRSGRFNLNLEGFGANTKVKVFNMSGILVTEFIVSEKSTSVDLSNYGKGMYLIKVSDGISKKVQKVIFE